MKSKKYNKNFELLKMIWTASHRDLFFAMPWLPIFSLAEVFLAVSSSVLLQLLFITNQTTVPVASLIPGNFRYLLPVQYTINKSEVLFVVPIVITSIALIKLVARFMSTYLTERAGHRTAYYLREQMLFRFLTSTGNKIDQINPDKIANQLMQDTALLQDAVSKGTMSAIRDFIVLIGIVMSMLFISWRVFLMGFVIIVLMTIVLRKISKKMNYYTQEGQKKQINISTRFLQTYQGTLVVNSLRSHGRELSDLNALNDNNYSFMKKSLFVKTFFSPTMEFIGILLLGILFFWRLNSVSQFQSVDYTAMIILMVFSFRYIKNIAGAMTFLSDLRVVFRRVATYFEEYQESSRNIHLSYLPKYSLDAVVANNVSFVTNESKQILDNCSVIIKKGQKVAFVGESGAGKTTLLRIIAGLLVPSEGHISVCENYLMAFQMPYVFRGTVKNNILYNQLDEMTDRANEKCRDLILALSLAFTESGAQIVLNKKLDFLGGGLSGGEKARVALARILFVSPKLILLDEPTANLDSASSKFFWKAIENWKSKDSEHTVITISHVLREVLDFDYCYLFKDGKIINHGLPRDILNVV